MFLKYRVLFLGMFKSAKFGLAGFCYCGIYCDLVLRSTGVARLCDLIYTPVLYFTL